jgi:serine protease Do
MKQAIKKLSFVILASALAAPVVSFAQDKEKDKSDKKEREQIIITRKGDKDEKMVIELNGDKVIVNGKPVDKDNDEVSVRRARIKDVFAYGGNGFSGSWNDNFALSDIDEDRAMLGVTTEKDSKGAEIQTISKESGAEKAGLKKGDIISRIDESKIEGPDDLSAAIKKHKPGDKVSISYFRDGKEQKATAELGKWKGVRQSYSYSIPNMNFDALPRIQSLPRIQGQNWNWSSGSPKLGLFVQDSEDGKGVKVIDVDEESNAAKAGLKEEDVITEIDGVEITGADQVARIVKDSKDKISLKMKILRKGKTENVDVKIPRKLKTADL